jgi:hypothetical protein
MLSPIIGLDQNIVLVYYDATSFGIVHYEAFLPTFGGLAAVAVSGFFLKRATYF